MADVTLTVNKPTVNNNVGAITPTAVDPSAGDVAKFTWNSQVGVFIFNDDAANDLTYTVTGSADASGKSKTITSGTIAAGEADAINFLDVSFISDNLVSITFAGTSADAVVIPVQFFRP